MADFNTNITTRKPAPQNTVITQTGVKLTPIANPLLASEKGIYVGTDNEFYYYDGTNPPVQLTAGGGAIGGGGGSPSGGFQDVLQFTPSTTNTSSASYVDIAGMSDQTFVTPIGGAHTLTLTSQAWGNGVGGGATDYQVQLVIDGTTYVELPRLEAYMSGVQAATRSVTVDLDAGSHTIRPQWKWLSGGSAIHADTLYPWSMLLQAQGSGISGLNVVEDTLAANFTVTQAYIDQPGANMAQVGSVQCVVTTLSQERVQVEFNATAECTAADDIIYGYQVDSDTPVVCGYAASEDNESVALSFSRMTDPLTPGEHTIKLMASRARANGSIIKGTSAGGAWNPKFQVTRFAIGGAGAGLKATTATLASDFTVSSVYPTYADVTGMSVAFSTHITGEQVFLTYTGAAAATSSLSSGIYLAYQLDGGADIPIVVDSTESVGTTEKNVSFAIPISIPLTGSHTIKLRAARSAYTWNLVASPYGAGKLNVCQFRGGIIPIKDEGTTIVDQPTALNFVGALVENDGGEARVTFPNAALGGFVQMVIEDQPAGDEDNTNTSYAAVTGVPQGTFTTPVSGVHLITLRSSGRAIGTDGTTLFRIVVDKGTASEQIIGASPSWNVVMLVSSDRKFINFFDTVNLSAGVHTVDFECRVSTMTLRRSSNDCTLISVQAQGTGINGLEVAESQVSSSFNITSVFPTFAQVESVQCVVNTLEGEQVMVEYAGRFEVNGGPTGSVSAYLGYSVDGGTTVPVVTTGCGNTSINIANPSFCVYTAPLTAGQHTIRFMACRGPSGGGTAELQSNAASEGKFRVTRFKSFGIGAGTISQTSTIGSNFVVSSATPQDTGFAVTFNSVAGESVECVADMQVSNSTGGNSLYFYYQLDGGSDVWLGYVFAGTTHNNRTLRFNLAGLSAGQHTVKIRTCYDTNLTWTIRYETSRFIVTQYRGGLIPFKQEGVTKVDKPSAVDIYGGIVTAVGTDVKIQFPNAALGGFSEMLTFSPTGTAVTTSGSYVDVTGMVNQTFVTPVTGVHILSMHITGFAQTNQADFSVRLIFDEGTANQQYVGMDRLETAPTATWQSTTNLAKVTLAAGSHTVRPQWYRDFGSGTSSTAAPWMLTIQGQGTGINGLEVVESVVNADVTISTTWPSSYQATGHSCVINVLEGERVQISYMGAIIGSSTVTNAIFGYRIDGGTVQQGFQQSTSTSDRCQINFSIMTSALSAGQHTIELMAAKGTANNFIINGATAGIQIANKMQVTRFKSFGIGAGSISTTSTIGVSKTITSPYATFEDTGMQVTITTLANESITLGLKGNVACSTFGGAAWAYSVDGGADVTLNYSSFYGFNANHNVSFEVPVTIATAGVHVIKLRAARATNNFVIESSWGPVFYATQYRGGLIPVKDDGVAIVDKPSALNFVGAIVQQNGTEAKVTFPNAALGGFMQKFTYTGAATTSSATFVDIGAMAAQSFTTPVSGQHLVIFNMADSYYGTASAAVAEYGVNIDGTDYVVTQYRYNDVSADYEAVSGTVVVNLAAGAHTIKPRWRRVSGSGAIATDGVATLLTVQAQGTGINGLEVAEDTLSSTWTQTNELVWEDTGLETSLQTLEGERVQLEASGMLWGATSGGMYVQSRFVIDGVTLSPQFYSANGASALQRWPLAMSWITPALSAGTHTFKVQSMLAGGSVDVQWYAGNMLQATRYKSFGIGAGTIVTTAELPATFTITSAYPTFADVTGLSATFIATANEVVDVYLSGNAWNNNTGTGQVLFAYQLDGGADIWVINTTTPAAFSANIAAAFTVGPLTAGSHTIKIRACKNTISGTMTPLVEDSNYPGLKIVQHRGGLIPFKQEGVTKVDKPSAVDLYGAVVTAVGTDVKVQFPNAALGGYLTRLTFNPTGTPTTTSSSFADIAGIVDQTFVTPVSGDHLISVTHMLNPVPSSGAVAATVRAVIDGSTYLEFEGVEIDSMGASNSWQTITQSKQVTLAAGAHTIRYQWKRHGGAGTLSCSNGYVWSTVIQAQGTGINGLEVVESTISADYTLPVGSFGSTGHSCTFNVLEGERVQVSFVGRVSTTLAGNPVFAYRVDGGSDVIVQSDYIDSNVSSEAVSFSFFIPALAAGQHTLELRAQMGAGAGVLKGTAAGVTDSKLQVTRFKSFGIGAGTIVAEDTLGANLLLPAAPYADTGLDVTINTAVANEDVLVGFMGDISDSVGGGTVNHAWVGISVDGAAEVQIIRGAPPSGCTTNFSAVRRIVIATAGQHTIKARAYGETASRMRLNSGAKLYALQYRGGLIPVKDDGVEIVEKPSALNFVGALVEQDGTEARVTFPNAALGGYTNENTFTSSGNPLVDNTSVFEDITGMSDYTFTTPVSGIHVFTLYSQVFAESPYTDFTVQLLIDGSETVVFSKVEQANTSQLPNVQHGIATLAAGSHTVRPQIKRGVDGVDGHIYDAWPWKLLISAQGTGINGLEVVESVLASPFTVVANYNGGVPGGGMAQVDSVQCVVNTLEGERVQVIWNGDFDNAQTEHVMGYQVDSDPAIACHYSVPVSVGTYLPGNWSAFTAPLSAGQHTIKLMAARTPSVSYIISAQSYLEPGTFQVVHFKSFGIGAGTLIASDQNTANVTVNSLSPTFMDTGLDIAFVTAVTSEVVNLQFSGIGWSNSVGTCSLLLAYQLDGGGDVQVVVVGPADNAPKNLSFTIPITVASAGPHTVKLRAAIDNAGIPWTFYGNASLPARLSVVQYRGGLIPIMENGVSVVDKPDSLDFSPDFDVTNPAGLKAFIDLNVISLATPGVVLPLAHNTVDLGADLTRFKDIYYAGTLYGGASPMKYKSKEADGASAIAHEFDTATAIANAAARLVSFKNNGVEKLTVDKDGGLRKVGELDLTSTTDYIEGSGYKKAWLQLIGSSKYWMLEAFDDTNGSDVFIDGSAGGTTSGMSIIVDGGSGNPGGSARFNNYGYGTYGGVGGKAMAFVFDPPTLGAGWASFLGLTGDGWLAGNSGPTTATATEWDFLSLARDDAGAVAFWLDTHFSMTTAGAKLLGLYNTGAEKLSVDKDGVFSTAVGQYLSQVADGASAVGFTLTTNNAFSTSGAKLLSVVNDTVEKFSIDKDGNVTLSGILDGVDVAAHDHSSSSGQARLAAKDRRRMAAGEKHAADSAAADTLSEHMLFQAQDAVTVTKIFFLPDAALTADDTNYATITVSRRDADGTNKVTIATVDTDTGGSGSWTAFDGVDLGTLTNAAIAAGKVITWEIAKAGSGVVVPAGALQVEYTTD